MVDLTANYIRGMEEANLVRFVTNYRWYYVVNYVITILEQVALWRYSTTLFFWIALVLNIIGIFSVASRLSKLEKQLLGK